MQPRISPQFVRFATVGLINTAVDTTIFAILRGLSFKLFVANIISTSVGLMLSLLLNYRYTFRDSHLTPVKIVQYIVITLCGLWLIQPVVIFGLTQLNQLLPYVDWVSWLVGHPDTLANVLPKLGSIVVTLIWNYVWYSRFIFRNRELAGEQAIAEA
jgi:putative flippase GtrA